jgi:hypothetical protein
MIAATVNRRSESEMPNRANSRRSTAGILLYLRFQNYTFGDIQLGDHIRHDVATSPQMYAETGTDVRPAGVPAFRQVLGLAPSRPGR